ncbi:hypothetical protein LZ31DRAFT_10941 [Colletotrichum somersetense]|nr:hypothetical protein LZ31DRAFT_10941 [Colletotrichum somersetense]
MAVGSLLVIGLGTAVHVHVPRRGFLVGSALYVISVNTVSQRFTQGPDPETKAASRPQAWVSSPPRTGGHLANRGQHRLEDRWICTLERLLVEVCLYSCFY